MLPRAGWRLHTDVDKFGRVVRRSGLMSDCMLRAKLPVCEKRWSFGSCEFAFISRYSFHSFLLLQQTRSAFSKNRLHTPLTTASFCSSRCLSVIALLVDEVILGSSTAGVVTTLTLAAADSAGSALTVSEVYRYIHVNCIARKRAPGFASNKNQKINQIFTILPETC